jgi:aspartate racemase
MGTSNKKMKTAAKQLEAAGADFILIATNTMHLMFDAVMESISIPVLHIADATASEIKKKSITTVGLLGTIFTMDMGFYKERLSEKHGISVITPNLEDKEVINDIIYRELVVGKIEKKSQLKFIRIMEDLVEKGAGGIVLGCTEIPLLIGSEDICVPVFDTTSIHATAAVEIALDERTF